MTGELYMGLQLYYEMSRLHRKAISIGELEAAREIGKTMKKIFG
jgi:hypothetical protein